MWLPFEFSVSGLTSGTASQAAVISEATLESLGKPTIARVRGRWTAWQDLSLGIEPASVVVYVGLGLMEAAQITVGVTAMPTPFTNGDWGGWLWWDCRTIASENNAVSPFPLIDFAVDNKAMRKAGPGQGLVLVIESGASLEGTTDLRAVVAARVLLLPS